MDLKRIKQKTAIVLLLGSLLIPVSNDVANATSRYFENYYDNPVGYDKDEFKNVRSGYDLTWQGDNNKETIKRKKFTKDSIYIRVSEASQGSSKYERYAMSTEFNGGGCDTINRYGYYTKKYRTFRTGIEYLVPNYVYEYAEKYGGLYNYNSNGKSDSYANCNLEFRPLKKCNSTTTNKIVGYWSPDSSGSNYKSPEGTIEDNSYPN